MTAHTMQIEVRFSELDPYGHLNHAVYATHFETARIAALRDAGLGLSWLSELGYHFVVTQLVLDYRRPARADDILTVTTGVTEVRRASTSWLQHMARGDELLASATIRSAITQTSGKAVRPPPWIFERLEPLHV